MERYNNYVLITGASSGLGECFAKRFAFEGYSLILTARRTDRLKNLKKELKKFTEKEQDIIIISADLSKPKEIVQLFKKVREKKIGVVINNAGFGDCGDFMETDLNKEMSMVNVNIKAMHMIMKYSLRRMSKSDKGYILNVASSAGLLPAGPYMATYYAAKAYVTSLTRAVACELKEKGSGIYVGALCPGPVDTEFNDVANVEFALKGITPEYCVNYAVDQMKKRKTIIVPTLLMKISTAASKVMPASFVVHITSFQQRKKLGK